MIDFIEGQLIELTQDIQENQYLVLQSQGIGYRLLTTQKVAQSIQADMTSNQKQLIRIYTTLIVREDAMTLVGFLDKSERQCFDLLLTASGVGAKSALALLATLSVPEMTLAIVSGNHKLLTAAKGVGPKLAEKLTIELRDKMKRFQTQAQSTMGLSALVSSNQKPKTVSASVSQSAQAASQNWVEAEMVLLSLGYEWFEIQSAFTQLQASGSSESALENAEASSILEKALKWLSSGQVKV